MPVDPKIEAPTRKLLGHALRGELDDFYRLLDDVGPEVYEGATDLAIKAAGYIAVDAAKRWPNGADIYALAKHAATTKGSQVTESEISDYLSRVVLGNEPVLTVFEGNEKAPLVPLFATADLLLSFSAKYADQWEYLDAIWNSLDEAETVGAPVAPAVTFLYGKSKK